MSWREIRGHLERNAVRVVPSVGAMPQLTTEQHKLLLRSLQRFHLGESGEGRIANEIDHVRWPVVDDDLRAVIKLWVREEGRHARILALMVNALGGQVLRRHWSAKAFEVGRRMLGVRFKLLVALAAEVGGMVFYALLARAMPHGPFSNALAELADDEREHLRFQSELFARMTTAWPLRVVLLAVWALCGGAACAVVLAEHARTLRAFGVSRSVTAAHLFAGWRDAAGRMCRAAPAGRGSEAQTSNQLHGLTSSTR